MTMTNGTRLSNEQHLHVVSLNSTPSHSVRSVQNSLPSKSMLTSHSHIFSKSSSTTTFASSPRSASSSLSSSSTTSSLSNANANIANYTSWFNGNVHRKSMPVRRTATYSSSSSHNSRHTVRDSFGYPVYRRVFDGMPRDVFADSPALQLIGNR